MYGACLPLVAVARAVISEETMAFHCSPCSGNTRISEGCRTATQLTDAGTEPVTPLVSYGK